MAQQPVLIVLISFLGIGLTLQFREEVHRQPQNESTVLKRISASEQIEALFAAADEKYGLADHSVPLNENLQSRSSNFAQNEKLTRGLSGKNVMGMMDKIEGILKHGVKPAKPSAQRTSPKNTYKQKAQYDRSSEYKQSINHVPLHIKVKEHHRYKDHTPYQPFDVDDYKGMWLNMLHDAYQIMNDEALLTEDPASTKTMEKVFHLLQDINFIDFQRKKPKNCPYSYDKAGKLCLSAENLHETLSWEDARIYCQVVKGGDLVIFKNACEYADALSYLRKIDPDYYHSYWLGATDLDDNGVWNYIDGTTLPQGAPYWGTRLGKMEPSSDDEIGQHYGILLGTDWYYIHDINNHLAIKKLKVLPLCQYIPERDGIIQGQKKPQGFGPYASYEDWKYQRGGIKPAGYNNIGYEISEETVSGEYGGDGGGDDGGGVYGTDEGEGTHGGDSVEKPVPGYNLDLLDLNIDLSDWKTKS